jgi:hypothetical protein
MVTSAGEGTSGYNNLPSILSLFQSSTSWLDFGANVHLCLDTSLFCS